jgi:SAM-dependent methyltransferase
MNQEKWKDFFGEEYLHFSELILTPERTQAEVEQIVSLLDLPKGAKILDLGCGQGRISIPLSQKGYTVTGFDGSPELFAAALRRADEVGTEVQLIHGDMRELDFDSEFDAVINLGTAFGYVEKEEEDLNILRRVRNALKPGGYFLQDTENREMKLKNQMDNVWHQMNGQAVWSKREFNCLTGRWKETISWMNGSELQQRVLDLRLYSATELMRMTNEAGLRVHGVYGGLDLTPLKMDSLRMVLLSVK